MNRKTTLIILGVIAFILVTISVTYAYWLVTKTQSGENILAARCLDISLSNEANDIALQNQFPITDSEGETLTPYTFTIVNNCNTSVNYQVNLEALGNKDTSVSPDALKAQINNESGYKLSKHATVNPTVNNAFEAYLLAVGTLEGKANVTYSLRIWVAEDASMSEMNKTFSSKVSVTAGDGLSNELPDESKLAINYGLTIGDFVNYNSGVSSYAGKWQVLGIEDNQVKLISLNPISSLTLAGKDGYDNGVSRLDALAAPFGSGIGADYARSVNADDINKVSGYNPAMQPVTNSPYHVNTDAEYGNTITYEVKDGNVIFNGSNGIKSNGNEVSNSFRKLENGALLNPDETYTITNTYYDYQVSSILSNSTVTTDTNQVGIKTDSKKIQVLVGSNKTDASTYGGITYWLANQSVLGKIWSVSWGIAHVHGNNANRVTVARDYLYNSNPDKADGNYTRSVRAVVYLNENVSFVKQSNGTFNIVES